MYKQKRNNYFADFLRGGALGTGILPGVSMGTVGIIVDVYDKLIDNIDGLRKNFKRSFLNLLPIILGLIIFTLSLMVFWNNLAIVYFPITTISLLAGFIIGGFPLMWREIRGKKQGFWPYFRFVFAFIIAAGIGVFAFVIEYLTLEGIIPGGTGSFGLGIYAYNPFVYPFVYIPLLLLGFMSALASIVPGVSGAMIMFISGFYNPIIELLIDKDFSVIINFDKYFTELWWSQVSGLLVLVVGILIGFLVTSHVMKKALETHRVATFEIVCGFVLGSLVSMFLNNEMCLVYYFDPNLWELIACPFVLIGSAIATYFLIRRGERKKKERAQEKIIENIEAPAE